jgi:hypothetical protein
MRLGWGIRVSAAARVLPAVAAVVPVRSPGSRSALWLMARP